jgi:hypothetical protein
VCINTFAGLKTNQYSIGLFFSYSHKNPIVRNKEVTFIMLIHHVLGLWAFHFSLFSFLIVSLLINLSSNLCPNHFHIIIVSSLLEVPFKLSGTKVVTAPKIALS